MFQYLHKTAAIAILSCLVSSTAGESTLTGTITGYGSASNDPTGSNAVCCGLSGGEHAATYDDPGTCASDNSKYPVNTKIYVPVSVPHHFAHSSIVTDEYSQGLQKYFVVQDSCADCVNQAVHFDLWMGPNSYTNYNNLLKCAESGGSSSGTIILDPAPGYTVDSTPLMDGSGNCDSHVDYSRTSPGSGGSTGAGSTSSAAAIVQQQAASTLATSSTKTKKGGKETVNTGNPSPGGSGGSGGSTGTCSWAGHCQGAACQTYNDCADPYSCVSGVCT